MSEALECPSFEEATNRFRAFLSLNGWPTEIIWVKSAEQCGFQHADQLERLQPPEAKRDYEFARHAGLGVSLVGLLVVRGSTFAAVQYPRDADEAERLMYPSDGGLKLSVIVTLDDLAGGRTMRFVLRFAVIVLSAALGLVAGALVVRYVIPAPELFPGGGRGERRFRSVDSSVRFSWLVRSWPRSDCITWRSNYGVVVSRRHNYRLIRGASSQRVGDGVPKGNRRQRFCPWL